jgi:serine/threonine-protein kinase HipA
MMVMGEGRNPKISHLIKLGQGAKIQQKLINEIIESTQSALNSWEHLAANYHVLKSNIDLISKTLDNNR